MRESGSPEILAPRETDCGEDWESRAAQISAKAMSASKFWTSDDRAPRGHRERHAKKEWSAKASWIDGVARLDHHRPLTDIPPHRWRQFLSDCNKFLTAGENWARRAAELGWNAATLFGCRRARPLDHPGGAGLLWAIQGGRLVELRSEER